MLLVFSPGLLRVFSVFHLFSVFSPFISPVLGEGDG
jgi:hypothetical protein